MKTNSFIAMGFDPDDAVVYAIRTDLADAIASYLRDSTQQQAADMLGVSQGLVSRIFSGQIQGLSIERLMRSMVRAGIPGFARWPSADTACAGAIAQVDSAATASGIVQLDQNYEEVDLSSVTVGSELPSARGISAGR